MPLSPDNIGAVLNARAAKLGAPAHCVIAFSGGLDSTVLLSLMADLAPALQTELLAVHVNHQLQSNADAWQAHCAEQAAALSVPFRSIAVDVLPQGGAGPEGNARRARYEALVNLLSDGDWLLSAHHQDDQAETMLLNLMRGSGISGLRGIADCRRLGRGYLLRPLLCYSRAEIEAYGQRRQLSWIDDPTNDDTAFDRNFLRGRVLPLLASRWPAASRQLARSALLAAEAAELIDELAAQDLVLCGPAERLSVPALTALSAARCRNVLRHACHALGLPHPPSRQLNAILRELLPARPDASPLVSWRGAEARRHRDHLYLLPPLTREPTVPAERLLPDLPLPLGAGLGQLQLEPTTTGGIAPQVVKQGLEVRYRQGGEVLRPAGRGAGKTLKQLLQEAAVVPWMRARVPLLYGAGSLVAVADLWVADEFFSSEGFRVVWQNKPAIC